MMAELMIHATDLADLVKEGDLNLEEACRIAGIIPTYRIFESVTPDNPSFPSL